MKQTTILAYAALIAAIAFALGPFTTTFDGFDPSLYPVPQSDPPAQPAGYAFAIWGVIYLALIAATALGALRHANDADWQAHRAPLLVSLLIGAIWLPVAEVSAIWATILIWAMLLGALAALVRVPASARWTLGLAVGLYAGWLTAASSVSVALTGAGWGLVFGEWGWAVVAVALATGIALAMLTRARAGAGYAFAAAWGLVGIVVRNAGPEPVLATIAGIAALAVALAGLMSLRRTS